MLQAAATDAMLQLLLLLLMLMLQLLMLQLQLHPPIAFAFQHEKERGCPANQVADCAGVQANGERRREERQSWGGEAPTA